MSLNEENQRNWSQFLKEWDQELKVAQAYVSYQSGTEIKSGLVMSPGATDQQLAEAEERLGSSLPPSYKDLLKISNGFCPIGFGFDRFHSAESVEWFSTKYEDWIAAYLDYGEEIVLPSVPDDRYFFYGSAQSTCDIRVEYLEGCLEISPPSSMFQDHIFLLNPAIVTSEGEWEAWSFANWKAGATRYRCLWEMLSDERRLFNERIAEFENTGR